MADRTLVRTGEDASTDSERSDGLGNLRRLPIEVRMLIWESLLAEPNCIVGFDSNLHLGRQFPTDILATSRQIHAESSHAFRRTGNLFIRVVGWYGSIFQSLRIFGIAANTNVSFENSRAQLSIRFPTYDGECFMELPEDSPRNEGDRFVFDIHVRDLSKLVRLIRFMHLSIDRSLPQNQTDVPLVYLKIRFLEQAPGDVVASSDEIRRVIWPFRRLLQPEINFRVGLPGEDLCIPDAQAFWGHQRNTIDCEELLWEIVNLALYITDKADDNLRIGLHSEAFDLYEMLVFFLHKQFSRPDLVEYLDSSTRAVCVFGTMYFYCSDGMLIAHLLTVRPTPAHERPPADFIRILFNVEYERSPTRALCFAMVFAAQGQTVLARQIVRDTIGEYEIGSWLFPRALHGLFVEAENLLNGLDEPEGFTDEDEQDLWSLVPKNRDMIIVRPDGVPWFAHDEIAD